jgi:SAM-dependent methyltransferase
MADAAGTPSLPEPDLLRTQAEWLAPARGRLFRRVHIARRTRVLDLGAGYGAVTSSLVRRSSGQVVALDLDVDAMRVVAAEVPEADAVGGDAIRLPFRAASFDLVFAQLAFLWISPLDAALDEVARVLMPGGALVALEPDYGGMIEHPPAVAARQIWEDGLERAGADPRVARKLPGQLAARGLDVRVMLFSAVFAADPARFDLLRGLPLTGEEREALAGIEEAAMVRRQPWGQIAHLPFFLIVAEKRG